MLSDTSTDPHSDILVPVLADDLADHGDRPRLDLVDDAANVLTESASAGGRRVAAGAGRTGRSCPLLRPVGRIMMHQERPVAHGSKVHGYDDGCRLM